MSHDNAGITNPFEINAKVIQQQTVPALGFGTWQLEGDVCQKSVECALETGYRHVDTARAYENEQAVGRGIAAANVPRSQLFVTSKVWYDDLSPESVARQIDDSLADLQLDYLDLVLIHWPNPDYDLEATLQAMLRAKENGQVRHIGVSNFPSKELKRALAYAPIFCNQVEYHVLLSQNTVLGVCRAHDVLLTAYCPLAKGKMAGDPGVQSVAKKHGKSPQQIALRWLLEQDHVAAIPRSSKPEHIQSNFDVFDFELDNEDRAVIAKLPKDGRICEPGWQPQWDAD